MLRKMVNGAEVVCSENEESQIIEYWNFNDKYPLYQDCNRYDGSSMPVIDMQRAKEIHLSHLERYRDWKVKEINEKIEMARENADSILEKELLSQRKCIRNFSNQDFSDAKTIDDLKLPEDFHHMGAEFKVR